MIIVYRLKRYTLSFTHGCDDYTASMKFDRFDRGDWKDFPMEVGTAGDAIRDGSAEVDDENVDEQGATDGGCVDTEWTK